MARDKLITIRIEGEKRQAFGELAKSQNTDTASLLYDFISGCLSGKIDIKLVTGKGNRIDKIDNQLDSDRLDKLEATTQKIDERVGIIAKKLSDWIEAFGDRLNDCDRELSDKTISLEHRLNALAIQLDSQQIDSEIDRIDTDSQKDRQGENPDIEPVATVEAVTDKVESDSIGEPVTGSIDPVPCDSPQMKTQLCEGMTATAAVDYLKAKKVKVSYASLHRWRDGVSIPNTSPQGRDVRKHLILRDGLYYPIN